MYRKCIALCVTNKFVSQLYRDEHQCIAIVSKSDKKMHLYRNCIATGDTNNLCPNRIEKFDTKTIQTRIVSHCIAVLENHEIIRYFDTNAMQIASHLYRFSKNDTISIQLRCIPATSALFVDALCHITKKRGPKYGKQSK